MNANAWTLIALMLALTGCDEAPVEPTTPAPPTPVVAREGLRYTASVTIASQRPLIVHTEVRVTNTTNSSVGLRIASHCAVLLRVYDNDGYLGRAVWDGAADAGACTTLVRPVSFGPGETRVFAADARPVLGRGRYFFVAVLRQADRDVQLAAGHADVDSM
ncbi:MAG: hypothetical protein L0271_08140 [Gemmatimonadetes bacterium]|nr:hypothetical protein [Gemmatimonadota bacterium]